jgi:carboxypeptidase family protein
MHRILVVSVLAAVAMALCLPPHELGAQEVGGRILGEGTGRPVVGAIVALLKPDLEKITATVADSTGWYRLDAPSAGDYVVAVESIGFVTLYSPLIRVGTDGPVSLEFRMNADPLEIPGLNVEVDHLEALRVEARLVGVRLEDLGQRFIDESFIRARWASRDISEVIQWRALPGITVYPGEDGDPPCVSLFRGRTGAGMNTCALVAMNGQLVSSEMLSLVPLDAIEAVMVMLPREATLVFGTGASSGVVVLITKVRAR